MTVERRLDRSGPAITAIAATAEKISATVGWARTPSAKGALAATPAQPTPRMPPSATAIRLTRSTPWCVTNRRADTEPASQVTATSANSARWSLARGTAIAATMNATATAGTSHT